MKSNSEHSNLIYSPENKENDISNDLNRNNRLNMMKSSEIRFSGVLKDSPGSQKYKSYDHTPETKNAYGCEFASVLRKEECETTEKCHNRFKECFPSDSPGELSPVVKLTNSPGNSTYNGGNESMVSSQAIVSHNQVVDETKFTLETPEDDSEFVCSYHSKKIEAFCNECKDTL
jgi:hypothetical protein